MILPHHRHYLYCLYERVSEIDAVHQVRKIILSHRFSHEKSSLWVKLSRLENTHEGTMRAMQSLHTESGTEKSEVLTWILKEFHGGSSLNRRYKSGLVGENVVEIEFKRLKLLKRFVDRQF